MSKVLTDADRVERMRIPCSTLEELEDDTQRLFDSIKAEALRKRAAAKKTKKARAKGSRSKR